MKIGQHPEDEHLTLEVDGVTRTTVEKCSRCGASEAFDEVKTMLNAISGGSAFTFQHSLPNCGKNGLKDLMSRDEKVVFAELSKSNS